MKITLLALAFFAAINASPIQISKNNFGDVVTGKINFHGVASNNVNQNSINAIIAMLNQQAAITGGNADARNHKIAVLKSLLDKKANAASKTAPVAVKMDPAVSAVLSDKPLVDVMPTAEQKYALLKEKLPESMRAKMVKFEKMRSNEKMSVAMPIKQKLSNMKTFKTPENFKIPASVVLPEKFQPSFNANKNL